MVYLLTSIYKWVDKTLKNIFLRLSCFQLMVFSHSWASPGKHLKKIKMPGPCSIPTESEARQRRPGCSDLTTPQVILLPKFACFLQGDRNGASYWQADEASHSPRHSKVLSKRGPIESRNHEGTERRKCSLYKFKSPFYYQNTWPVINYELIEF